MWMRYYSYGEIWYTKGINNDTCLLHLNSSPYLEVVVGCTLSTLGQKWLQCALQGRSRFQSAGIAGRMLNFRRSSAWPVQICLLNLTEDLLNYRTVPIRHQRGGGWMGWDRYINGEISSPMKNESCGVLLLTWAEWADEADWCVTLKDLCYHCFFFKLAVRRSR